MPVPRRIEIDILKQEVAAEQKAIADSEAGRADRKEKLATTEAILRQLLATEEQAGSDVSPVQ